MRYRPSSTTRGPRTTTVADQHELDGYDGPGEGLSAPGPLDVEPVGGPVSGRGRAVAVAQVVAAGYLAVTITLVLAGELVMSVVVGSWVGDIDSAITHWFARSRSGPFDAITRVLSHLGDTFTVLGVAVGAGTVLLASRLWRQAAVLAVGLPLELSVFLSTTYAVRRPRPDVEALDSVPATASFPSGHMAASMILYGGLALIAGSLMPAALNRRWVWAAVTLIAAGVGLSRVYRGLHHPSDVVAGAFLGVGCIMVAVLAARFLPGPANRPGDEVQG